MPEPIETLIYHFKVVLRRVSPMIWRRLLVRSDSTIADLHHTLQIALGWTDSTFTGFASTPEIFGVYHAGGLTFDNLAHQIDLASIRLRPGERFLYSTTLATPGSMIV